LVGAHADTHSIVSSSHEVVWRLAKLFFFYFFFFFLSFLSFFFFSSNGGADDVVTSLSVLWNFECKREEPMSKRDVKEEDAGVRHES
jgi:hypothetical protein